MLTADIRHARATLDVGGVKFKDYTLLNAKVVYQINESTELYVRGENLLNQTYQRISGYNTPGIAAYAGFKAKF